MDRRDFVPTTHGSNLNIMPTVRQNHARATVQCRKAIDGSGFRLRLTATGGKKNARHYRNAYEPSRQRFMKSLRSGPWTFCATACLRQVRRASVTHTVI